MQLVEQSEKLQEIYGRWPSFHDAEVERIELAREASSGDRGPTIRIEISMWEMTSEIDSRGFYVRKNFVLATLKLYSAEIVHLLDFNGQNVISGLSVEKLDPPDERLRLVLGPCYGVSAEFLCRRVEVASVDRRAVPTHAA